MIVVLCCFFLSIISCKECGMRHTDYGFIRLRDKWVVKQQKTHVLVKRQE